jgi:hypothetical protein
LKRLSHAAVPAALKKAQHYRLLHDPAQAESICLDVLDVEPDNQEAMVTLVLALTDQFGREGGSGAAARARTWCARLTDAYERTYYTGIIAERRARACLQGAFAPLAYDGLRDALRWYERAERLRPPANDDAILRWNSCVRTIVREHLEPLAAEPELLLE